MNKKINKMVITIIILTIISTALIMFLVVDSGKRSYKNDDFSIKYEKNWHVNKINNDGVEITHKSGADLIVKIIYLESEYRKTDLSVLIEDILKKVEENNPAYRLVNKEQTLIGKDGYEAYKYLYETDDLQSLIGIGKKNDKIFIITYTANIQYFDILLDSVKDIIWNFKILR